MPLNNIDPEAVDTARSFLKGLIKVPYFVVEDLLDDFLSRVSRHEDSFGDSDFDYTSMYAEVLEDLSSFLYVNRESSEEEANAWIEENLLPMARYWEWRNE